MVWTFDEYVLNVDRRELHRGTAPVELEPQAFDMLVFLVRNRERVVGKDELFQAIWGGRIVSNSALTTRLNAVRRAVGDNGQAQRLIRTLPRKGVRFVGEVVEAPGLQARAEFVQTWGLARQSSSLSITVLPFIAISDTAEERSFARGLFENIVTSLNCFRWISVVAPSSDRYSRSGAPEAEWTRGDSSARYSVQGAIHLSGERLRVTARLVDATGSHLWADRCDGMLSEIFDLQDRVVAKVAGSFEPTIQAAEARRYNALPSRKATPHELHLRAQPIFSNGKENVLRSMRLLERAIALDPNYAPALADVAFCLQVLDINGWVDDRPLTRRRAIDYARKALQVSCDAEPIATAAHVFAYFGEDVEVALALADQATARNPYLASGWYSSGMARLYAGQLDDAAERFETSARLSPWDHVARRSVAGLGIIRLFDGRLDEAIPRLRLAVREFPQWATIYSSLASCYAHLGFDREAVEVARRLKAVDPSLMPTADQFRDVRHRELLAPGLRLAGT
jgi:DNA-binding winged helix-turn-helix (wHTH) protein/tetratricopeptide (TPR) repeat protein